MAAVPSVCVRVPHSPSIDSGPCTPMKKLPFESDFTALAVRECATEVCMQNDCISKKNCINLQKKLNIKMQKIQINSSLFKT